MNKVAVLMSTYNGERFIREQLDSILAQVGVEVRLFIRDDGSKDRTIEIIEEFVKQNENISLFKGENIGVGNSFMNLLYQVGNDYDYYAFADQDDVWLPVKLVRAVELLGNKSEPTLYASNQMLVDQNLNGLGLRFSNAPGRLYKQIICQNKLSGCTMVWNRALHCVLREEKRRPDEELLRNRIHDVWVVMVAAATGTIIYDDNSYILYRQHENNVVGVRKTNLIKQWQSKLIDPKKRKGRSLLCKELFTRCGDLLHEEMIEDIYNMGHYEGSFRNKLKLLKDKEITHYSGETLLGYRIKVILNLF